MSTATLAAPAPAAAKPTTKRKISFAKPAAASETKTAYPVFNDPAVAPQVMAIAARIKERTDQLDALEGAQETDKAELKLLVSPFYYRVNAHKHDAPSSISVPSPSGEVLVTYQNRYSTKLDEAALVGTLGQDAYDRHFRQTFSLAIKGDKLPVGHEQDIVDAITAVLEKHGALDALEVKDGIAPNKEFHAARLHEFTPEQNLAIEQVCPIVAMVKTKGRK